MQLPVSPPAIQPMLTKAFAKGPTSPLARAIFERHLGPAPDGRYRHWDTLRHVGTAGDLTAEERWAAVKLARQQLYVPLPMLDKDAAPFQYAIPSVVLDYLHRIDRDASGTIAAPELITSQGTQTTYLLRSIVEEAIRSSQLEGASTTRRVAKDMLLSGREPADRSERMIRNNFEALQYVRANRGEPITPSRVIELQSMVTAGTLDEPDGAGRLRSPTEHIVISDELGNLLHDPPRAEELPVRLRRLCDFANGGGTKEFMHPVVRALLVHFAIGYDHPFVDGNGRTARALFYWIMAREGYWLCEYLSISRILKRARARYSRAFLYTKTDENDTTYFLLHQLDVLVRSIADLHAYLAAKAAETREVDELVRAARGLKAELNARQLALVTHALKHPDAEYSVDSHQRAHEVAYATARADLLTLVRQKILLQRKRGRAFVFVPAPTLRGRLTRRPTVR